MVPLSLNVMVPSALYQVPLSDFSALVTVPCDRSAAKPLPDRPMSKSAASSKKQREKDMMASQI
jgi:hypothetical protein